MPDVISLNFVLLFPVNFASEFRLKLMYIFLIVNIRSSLTHLDLFQLLAAVIAHEITFFICSNRANLLNLI